MNWKINHTQTKPWDKTQALNYFFKVKKITAKKTFLNPPSITLNKLIKETKISETQLKKALTLINKNIKEERPIIVYGDYDVDGICATAICWQTLYKLHPQTLPFIPDRFKHGYGLSDKGLKDALKLFPRQKPLVITVDNGITAGKIIEKYKKKGVDFILTDHHQIPSSKPKVAALIHSDKVCGTTVSLILSLAIQGSHSSDGGGGRLDSSERGTAFLGLTALATVCDQIPLTGINRSLVIHGLKQINSAPSIGLAKLIQSAAIKPPLTVYHLGFIIGPRLNAAGRLKDPLTALRLLCTPNQKQAIDLAKQLNDLNTNRQQLTASSINLALKQIEKLKTLPGIISIHHKDFHEGIIGLIAGRLADKFNRPAIALSTQDGFLKASCRSACNFNIISFLRQKTELFEELGGHPAAAGFVIKKTNLSKLKKFLATAKIKLSQPKLNIDLLLHPEQNLESLYQAISSLAPFGQGWPEPLLALQNTKVLSHKYVGQDQKHLQLKLRHQGKTIPAIAFNHPPQFQSTTINLAFYLSENIYQGTRSLQLIIKDIMLK